MNNKKGKNFSSKDATGLKDEPTRNLLFKLLQYVERNPLLSYGFDFLEYTFSEAATDKPIAHGLGYAPKDIILTSKTGTASVTINYALATDKYVYVTSTGATTIRLMIGTYRSE